MISSIALVGSRWWPVAVALVGVWVTARNLLRVYREHCAEEVQWAEEWWQRADAWVERTRTLCEMPDWSDELEARCLRNADECERLAARWFLKGCGGLCNE